MSWVNKIILSNPLIVWIGLISYPLYLFHWPALSFVRIVHGGGNEPLPNCAALAVSLLLAVITYYLIEQKIRRNPFGRVMPFLVAGFLFIGMLGVLAMTKLIHPIIDPRIEKTVMALNDKDFFSGMNQHASKVGLFTVGGQGSQTVFVGDSNMEQYMPRIVEMLRGNHGKSRGAIFIVYTGLPPIPGFKVNQFAEGLSLMPELEVQLKSTPQIDRVVITAAWTRYFTSNENSIERIPATDPRALDLSMKALGSLIRSLVDQGKKVTVVLSIPMGPKFSPANCLNRGYSCVQYTEPKIFPQKEFLEENKSLLAKIAETAVENGAQVIDPLAYLSKDGLIMLSDENGYPVSYDGYHLRPGFVREHVKYLDETVAP
jgi:hypothetical protein